MRTWFAKHVQLVKDLATRALEGPFAFQLFVYIHPEVYS